MTESSSTASSADADPSRRMVAALREIRREGRKVASIYAVVDAAFVALAVNLVVLLSRPEWVPAELPVPTPLVAGAERLLGSGLGQPTVGTSIVVGAAVGVVVLVAEFVVRVRRPIVEQFENANPAVGEALRTARDTVEDGRETPMAVALYEDVLDRLRQTSSVGLVDLRRVTVTILLLLTVSVASIQVAVVDLDLALDGGDDGPGDATRSTEYEGLQDGDAILGDPEAVDPGDEEIQAQLASQGEGGGDDGSAAAPTSYDTGGFTGPGTIESQQAGFAQSEQLEDAELIREYNLKIRDQRDE